MIKTVALIAQRPELSREQFARHWVETHATLVRTLPGLRRYVQGHAVDRWTASGVAAVDGEIDGIAELWFDDRAAMERAYASPAAQVLAADGSLFIGRITFYIMDEKVLVPSEA